MLRSAGSILLSRDEFKELLFDIRGAKPITITARTEPDLVGGKKCPLHGLKKVSVVNGLINVIYENSVNRVREREAGDEEVEPFIAGPRKWGVRLYTDDNRRLPLVDKLKRDNPYVSLSELKQTPADRLCLELKVQKSLGHTYELDGVEIPDEEVLPHLRPKPPREVILRDYGLVNIENAVLNGETFILGNEMSPMQLLSRQQKKGGVVAV